MPENKDPREVEEFSVVMKNNYLEVQIKGGYFTGFHYLQSPTGNCQLAGASNFCSIIGFLNKYKIRDLFIKMRKCQFYIKRILLLDLNRNHALSVVEWLAPGCIIGNMPYTSTNGSEMNILLIKLSSVRQLQLPK